MTPSIHRAGERIGKYTLESELGRGGMGEVWQAVDDAGNVVALKLMLAEHAGSAERRSRFMREARLLANVRHPHVVGIRDVFAHRNGLALAMDRLIGETLKERLARGPVDVALTIALVEQLLDALDAIHGKGVVHRDLKPDNLFLVDRGDGRIDVRILDFGIANAERVGARTLTDLTQAGELLGTPAYMSPEQLFGEEVDARSDLWSVGIIAYTCITGTCPTDDAALGGVIRRVTKDPIPSIRSHASGPLADLVDAVLRKERDERPANARACVAILNDRAVRPANPSRRRRGLLLGAAAALLAGVTAAALASRSTPRSVTEEAKAPSSSEAATVAATETATASSGVVLPTPPAPSAVPAVSLTSVPSTAHGAAPSAKRPATKPASTRPAAASPATKASSTAPRVEDIVLAP